MKTGMQLKALIRNVSAKSNVDAGILLVNFMVERFLERVSISKYKNNLVLKGGVLVSSIVGFNARTTMDIDATYIGRAVSMREIETLVEDILRVPIDDGAYFTFKGVVEIREEADYPSYRVSLDAAFDKIRQTIKIDITGGDLITPKAIEYSYKLMLEALGWYRK